MITIETEGKSKNVFAIDEVEKAIKKAANNVFFRKKIEDCTFVYFLESLVWYSSEGSPRVGVKGSIGGLEQEIVLIFKSNVELWHFAIG
jgi:hypothetical protein